MSESATRRAYPTHGTPTLGPIHGFAAMFMRQLRAWYRDPVFLLLGLIQPVVWIGLYGKSFPSSVAIPGVSGGYFSFLAVGMVSFVVLFSSVFGGMAVVFDKQLGHLKRILVTSVSRGSIVMSYTLANVVKSLAQAVVLLAVAVVLGLTLTGFTPLGLAATFTAEALLALGLSALFTVAGLLSKSSSVLLAVMNFVALPLMFASNSLFPVDAMPGWIQGVSKLNPMTYANDAARQALLGSPGIVSVPVDLAILAAFGFGLSLLSIFVSRRQITA